MRRPPTEGVPPRVLAIAGSDSAGASGLQADLRTIAAFGCYGTTAVTAVTAQDTLAVRAVHAVPAAFVVRQVRAVLDDVGADAVKTGMLWRADVVRAVARALRDHRLPLVVDPVLRASSGRALAEPGVVAALVDVLLPLATLLTPNLPEAEALLGRHLLRTRRAREEAAAALVALGPAAVLLKGGHADGARSDDLLVWREDGRLRQRWLRARRLPTPHTRGTGCTLATACACLLAQGLDVPRAVARAKAHVTRAIAAGARRRLGHGPGPAEPACKRHTNPDGRRHHVA